MKKIMAILMTVAIGNAWAVDPVGRPTKQDPTRSAGIYRIELARFKESQVKQLQELLDHQGAIQGAVENSEIAGETEGMTRGDDPSP